MKLFGFARWWFENEKVKREELEEEGGTGSGGSRRVQTGSEERARQSVDVWAERGQEAHFCFKDFISIGEALNLKS